MSISELLWPAPLGLSDMLPHRLMLTDHTMLLARPLWPKSLTLFPKLAMGAGWELYPLNCEVRSDAEMDRLGTQVGSMISLLPKGIAIQVINVITPQTEAQEWAERRRGISDGYRIPVSHQIAHLSRGAKYASASGFEGRLRQSRVFLTIRQPLGLATRSLWPLIRSNFDLQPKKLQELNDRLKLEMDTALIEFETLREIVGTSLSARQFDFRPQPLDASGLLGAMDAVLGGIGANPVYVPGRPVAAQLGAESLSFDEDRVLYRSQAAALFSLHGLPARTDPSLLSGQRTREENRPLAVWEGQNESASVVVTNLHLPSERKIDSSIGLKEMLSQIETMSEDNKSGEYSFGTGNVTADINLFKEHVYEQSAVPVYMSNHMILWESEPSRLGVKSAGLMNRGKTGIKGQIIRESVLTQALLKRCLPLGFDPTWPDPRHVQRDRLVTSITGADMLPLYGAFRGTRHETPSILFQNRLGEPVYVDHFDYPAGHAIVTANTGSGKSFLVNHITAQMVPLGASVVILDRLASYEGLCNAYGGDHIAIDWENPVVFNRFAGSGDEEHRVDLVAFLCAILEEVSSKEDGILTEAVTELFDQPAPGREYIMSDFAEVLNRPHTNWGDNGTELALRLAPFYAGGRFSGFIDGQSTFKLNENLTVFELSELDNAPQLQTAISMSLMQILGDYFGDPVRLHRPKFIFNDELWALMLHPASARVMVNIARTYRKRRTAAVFITQHPQDLYSADGKTIRGLCSIRYFLQMEDDIIDEMAPNYALSNQEVRVLKSVERGDQYSECYVRLPGRRGGVVRLVPDPHTLMMASQEDLSIGPRVQREMAENGGDFNRALDTLIKRDVQHD